MKKILLPFCFFVSFCSMASQLTIKSEIVNKRIYISLVNDQEQKKMGVATGTEFPDHIQLGILNILYPSYRKSGYGSQLLQKFLSYAKTRNKPVFANATPIGTGDFKELLSFYQNHGALVLYKINNESASIVFQQHHLKGII